MSDTYDCGKLTPWAQLKHPVLQIYQNYTCTDLKVYCLMFYCIIIYAIINSCSHGKKKKYHMINDFFRLIFPISL